MLCMPVSKTDLFNGMEFAVIHDDPGDPLIVTTCQSPHRAELVAQDLNERTSGGYIVARRVRHHWVWGAGSERAVRVHGVYGTSLNIRLQVA